MIVEEERHDVRNLRRGEPVRKRRIYVCDDCQEPRESKTLPVGWGRDGVQITCGCLKRKAEAAAPRARRTRRVDHDRKSN